MRKAVSMVSGIIFLALTISAVAIVYEAGVPVIRKMQSAATIENMKDSFTTLDSIIQQVAAGGKGSKRTTYMNIDTGTFSVNSSDDTVSWRFDTDAFVISPRTYQRIGNLIVGSNLDTELSEVSYHETSAYLLENEHLKVYIKRFGSADNRTSYQTGELLMGMYQKDLGQWLPLSSMNITVDNNLTTSDGTGYTKAESIGSNLPYGVVTAYVNSDYINYYINFTLESGTDFVIINSGVLE